MRLATLVPSMLVTFFMVVAYVIVVTFENQISTPVKEVIAEQEIAAKAMPFMNMSTSGNLVLSFGAFLVVTLIADLVLFVPLFLLGRRARSKDSRPA